jgi:hypothetical protein
MQSYKYGKIESIYYGVLTIRKNKQLLINPFESCKKNILFFKIPELYSPKIQINLVCSILELQLHEIALIGIDHQPLPAVGRENDLNTNLANL